MAARIYGQKLAVIDDYNNNIPLIYVKFDGSYTNDYRYKSDLGCSVKFNSKKYQ